MTPTHDHSAQLIGGAEKVSYALGGGYSYLGRWSPGYWTKSVNGYGSMRREEGRLIAEASARFGKRDLGSGNNAGQVFRNENHAAGVFTPNATALIPWVRNPSLNTQTLGLVVTGNFKSWWQQRATVGSDNATTSQTQGTPLRSSPTDSLLRVQRQVVDKLTAAYSTTFSGTFTEVLGGTITAGVDYMNSKDNSSLVQSATTVGTLGGGTTTITRIDETNKGYFATGRLSFAERVFLSAGLRADDNSNYGKDYGIAYSPNFGVSLVQDVGPATAKLRAVYGQATRAPLQSQRGTRYATDVTRIAQYGPYREQAESPNLGPEEQKGGEGGIELYLGDRASLQVTTYNQLVNHMIIAVAIDSTRSLAANPANFNSKDADGFGYIWVNQNQNLAAVRNRGWESQGEYRLAGGFALGGTWSYNKSRIRNMEPHYVCSLASEGPGACFAEGQVFFNMSEHTGALRLTYSGRKTQGSVNVSHIGQRTFNLNNDIFYRSNLGRLRVAAKRFVPYAVPLASEGYSTMDISANRYIGKRTTLTLKVINATDSYRGDFWGSYYARIGRSSMLGVRISGF